MLSRLAVHMWLIELEAIKPSDVYSTRYVASSGPRELLRCGLRSEDALVGEAAIEEPHGEQRLAKITSTTTRASRLVQFAASQLWRCCKNLRQSLLLSVMLNCSNRARAPGAP